MDTGWDADRYQRQFGFVSPWRFPTPAEQAGLPEAEGFRVARMEYFPRPTPLTDCPGGLADWVTMFGGSMTAQVPAALLPGVLGRVNQLSFSNTWPETGTDSGWCSYGARPTPAARPSRGFAWSC